jgi:hypothetical protein
MSAMTIFQEKIIFVCRLLQIYFLKATVIIWYLPLALCVLLCNKTFFDDYSGLSRSIQNLTNRISTYETVKKFKDGTTLL